MANENFTDNKCPSCGATLAYDPSTGGLVCSFCGSNVKINTIPAAPGLGYWLQDLQNGTGSHLLKTTNKQIVCGTCGGQFSADQSAISGLCPFCGSNSITVSNCESGILEPTGVIPFKIGKDEAQEIFKNWLSARRLAPMDLTKNTEITNLVGVYIPYWVFDCDTYTPYKGKFGKYYGSGDDRYIKWHKADSVCKMPVKDLTLLASSRLEKDSFWKGVSKFDINFTKRYDPNLLAGFWSESYTIDAPTAWQTAMGTIYERIKNQILKQEDANTSDRLDMKPEATNIRAKYILAPIWITSFNYHDQIYQVLINGQTGYIDGIWPKSYKKFFMTFGLIAGGIVATRILYMLFAQLIQFLQNLGH